MSEKSGLPMGPFAAAKAAGVIPSEDERQYAFYAHIFGTLGLLFTASSGLHLLAPLVPLLMTKERTPFMMFHVNQSLWFQGVLLILNVIVGVTAFILTFFCIGWLLFPINGLLVLTALIYPIFVALRAKNGEWAEYAVIGEQVLQQKSPVFK